MSVRKRVLKVVEWPESGSARRYPVGGWWVLEETRHETYLPMAGPYEHKETAELAYDIQRLLDAADGALPWLVLLGNYIGNGTDEDPNGRCDVILAIKNAIDQARGREEARLRQRQRS